jgi:hypothetical protein
MKWVEPTTLCQTCKSINKHAQSVSRAGIVEMLQQWQAHARRAARTWTDMHHNTACTDMRSRHVRLVSRQVKGRAEAWQRRDADLGVVSLALHPGACCSTAGRPSTCSTLKKRASRRVRVQRYSTSCLPVLADSFNTNSVPICNIVTYALHVVQLESSSRDAIPQELAAPQRSPTRDKRTTATSGSAADTMEILANSASLT